jgi:uncharacterized membrane protein YccC
MADIAVSPIESVHPLIALWRTLRRVEKPKINDWWMALRNALAVAIPLGTGIAMGYPLAAVAVATGSLNVAFSDGRDPYYQRARRMLLWSLLSGVAVFVGSITGQFHIGAVLVAAAWAFIAGMMLGISNRAGDLGLNTLVSVVVFAARGSSTPLGALYSGLLVAGGGLLQTTLAVLFWPLGGNKPEMVAIGHVFATLAEEVNPDADTPAFVPIPTPTVEIKEALSALGSDHSIEGERLRLLFDQADRLRLSIYLVKRLRDELGEGDNQNSEAEGDAADDLDQFLKATSKLLAAVGNELKTGTLTPDFQALRKPLVELVDGAQTRKHDGSLKLGAQIASALDVLAGQLRLVVQLTTNTTEEGEKEFLKGAHAKPWKLQTADWRATIKANLTWKSPVFRHAVRLSACIALADVMERAISVQRAYWLPMTAAVVLKPDFQTTFSRGALRLAGTVAGLLLATLIFLALPQSAWTQLLLVGAYTYMLRWLGPANYGVFTLAISGLIVFLLAAVGTPPAQVVLARGINTLAGGLLALIAYAVWPTWEKSTISDSLADMLEGARAYFRAVATAFHTSDGADEEILDRERSSWRLKRSAAEAAVDRVASEPGNGNAKLDCLASIMASSRALMHATMGLEAGLLQSVKRAQTAVPEAFRTFANDVDFTLYYLTNALHGSKFAASNLPLLREDHRRMLETRDSLGPLDEYVVIETDRLTVSLNTLREQVARYLSGC